MDILETIVNVGNEYVWSFPSKFPWLVALLLGAGFFVTARLALVQVRQLGHALRVVRGKYDDPNDPGDVNHFQALSTALSATVGIGNIAGVATAIHYGGPGAVFWMWVTAFFGMALKFSECTLSMHYRSFDDRGDAAGGPMYYIEKGLGKSWKPLAMAFAFFAIVSSFGGGNMNQANTVAVSADSQFGLAAIGVGVVLAILVGVVILGGIRSIAKVASALAPSMAVLYVLGALTVLALNIGDVPAAFATIFREAFNPSAGIGGSVAGIWSVTLLWGVKRGLFSNEAGQGSAPIAHAAAKTKEPVREGAVAMLGPLIDTLIICTMTALVITVTGVWDKKKPDAVALSSAAVSAPASAEIPVKDGVQMPGEGVAPVVFSITDGPIDNPVLYAGDAPYQGTLVYDAATNSVTAKDAAEGTSLTIKGNTLQNSSALTGWAFEVGLSDLGDWGAMIVTICVFLFAVSTMISWSYYGDRCVTYLFGSRYVIVYRAIYIVFIYVGATRELEVVWAYGDLALGLMSVPNLLAVLLLSPKVVELSRDYFRRMKDQGLPKAQVVDE